jgi:hypothetical protein
METNKAREPNAEPTTSPTNKLWVTTLNNTPRRNRAGLRFEHGKPREVEILADLSDAEIRARQEAGAYVVNATGEQAIRGDSSLDVRDTAPPPPAPPRIIAAVSSVLAGLIGWWALLASVLRLKLPSRREPARLALRAAVGRRVRTATDPMLIATWRRIDELIEGDAEHSEELNGLLYLIDADVPGPRALSPVARRRYASNEGLLPHIVKLAEQIDLIPPPRFDGSSYETELRRLLERLQAAEAQPSGDRHYRPSPTEAERMLAERVAIPELRRMIADVGEQRRLAHRAWSESMDLVRRRVLASIDHAIAGATSPPLVRFALDCLGRAGRGIAPITHAISPDDALSVVLGAVPLEAQPDPVGEPGPLIKARVRTARDAQSGREVPRRSRAGFMFGPEPKEIACTAEEFAEIRADSALIVDGYEGRDTSPASLAERAQLERENAELRAQLAAARRNAPADPGDGSSSRLRAVAKARVKQPTNRDPDDDSGGEFL